MDPKKQEQINKQIEGYENKSGTSFTKVSINGMEIKLQVDPFVADPSIMNSGLEVVRFLEAKPSYVKNKIVTDMGTGSGILGITAAVLGADKVLMSDIDLRAVENAKKNVQSLKLSGICEVLEGDLFEPYASKPQSEVQIFNHPFFLGDPIDGKEWTRMMLAPSPLLERYLREAPGYSTRDAVYIFPWLTLAGDDIVDNDPKKIAPKFGYSLIEEEEHMPENGLQQQAIKVYVFEYN